MNEHDDRLSELYRQSSQETPSVHVDRAVLDMARKSVHRKLHSPFGASWLVRGATVGVMVLSVLLIMTEQEKSPQDGVQPSQVGTELKEERSEADEAAFGQAIELKKKPSAPAASKPGLDFHDTLPELEVVVPEEVQRRRMQQVPAMEAPASKAIATPEDIPVTRLYLQVGAFREKQRAIALRDRLVAHGFDCEIEEARVKEGAVYFRVRVGPFADQDALVQPKQRLDEMNIETQTITVNG